MRVIQFALSRWLVLSALISAVSGEASDLVGKPCMSAASTYQYGCAPGEGGYTNYYCLSQNAAYMGTAAYCISEYAESDKAQSSALETMNENCMEVTNKTFTERDLQIMIINATRFVDAVHSVPNTTQVVDLPFKLPEALIENYLKATAIDNDFMKNNIYIGAGLLGYFAFIFLLRMLSNLAYRSWPGLLRFFDSKFSRKVRKHIMLPGTFSQKHRVAHSICGLNFNIPSRAQTLTILGYQILHIILLCIDYNVYRPSYLYMTKEIHISNYIGVRSANLAVSQLPLVFLFGARNNFLIPITGWKYDVFNMFHRWVTRGVLIDILIHAIAFSILATGYHDYLASWKETYWRWGAVSACAGGLIFAQSLSPLRHACYQAFLYIHIPLVIAFIVGAWWHCDDVGKSAYIYASVAIWIYDRVARWVRILWTGGVMSGNAKLHAGGVMEVTIDYSQRWKWRAGTFGYLHISRWNKIWQSRPFTILAATAPDEYGKLKIFAKARGMMTKSNWNYFKRHPHLSTNINIMLEGPYGVDYPLHNYDSVVLIAGGIGITATYGYALEIRNRLDRKIRVTFIWVIADSTPLEWFSDQLNYINQDDRFDVQIFVSNNNSGLTIPEKESVDDFVLNDYQQKNIQQQRQQQMQKSSNKQIGMSISDVASTESLNYPSQLNVINSRPNLRWLVFQQIMKTSGTLAFMTCGPDAMSDDIRVSIAENIESANARVDYFEEAFSF